MREERRGLDVDTENCIDGATGEREVIVSQVVSRKARHSVGHS